MDFHDTVTNENIGEGTFYAAPAAKISSRSMQIMLEGNGVGQRLDLQAAIKQRFGWDYKHPSPLSLPYSQYLATIEFLRQELYPNLDPDQAYQILGYQAIKSFLRGISGEIFRVLAQIMGPQHGAQRFVQYIAGALPWGQHQMVEVRPHYACYRKRNVGGPPALMLGVIWACLEISGAKSITIRYRIVSSSASHEDVLYEAEWK